jgi:predicted nucleotidyltransferase
MRINGIDFDEKRIASLCGASGVVRLFVFGSILSERFGPDSDIDVLVETDPLRPPGLLALGGLQMDLSELLGRTVHLTLLGGVPAAERPAVLAQARMLNAA